MKEFLILCIFLLTGFLMYAQTCTPDPAYVDQGAGIYPLPYDAATNPDGGIDEIACIGQPYEFSFTSVNDTLEFNGTQYVIESFTLSSIEGLPEGLDYACDPPDCAVAFGEVGCLSIYGTPTAANEPGIYELTITMTAILSGFPITIEFPNPDYPGSYAITLEGPGSPNCEECVLTATSFVENTGCVASCTGSITVTPSVGVPPYEYQWDAAAGNQTTATITGLCAGDYSVTVTDQLACAYYETITVEANPDIELSLFGNTSLNCFGDGDGSIDVNINNGEAPYTYSWNTGSNVSSLSDLTAGDYSVTVTDVNNCEAIASINISQPSQLEAMISAQTNVQCSGQTNGAATVSVLGGTAPYEYLWSNNTTQSTASNLPAGNYTVTVTDANDCTATASVTITIESNLSTSINTYENISCFGENDGTASAEAMGGISPYSYSWSNAANTAQISNLGPGTYTITVTDGNNCTSTASVVIIEPDELFIFIEDIVDVECFGEATGSAAVSVSGGTPPYSYNWSSGSNSSSESNLNGGDYFVIITDSKNCEALEIITISQPDILNLNISTTNETSPGANDGTAFASVSGGTAPYSYSWSNGSTASSISDLAPGDYTLTVTDANQCEMSETIIINEIECSISINVNVVPASCNGEADGQADVVITGGTAPFSYLWSAGSTASSQNNLVAGSYNVIVTDAEDCAVSSSFSISEPPLLTASISDQGDVSCEGADDGFAMIAVSGGTPPYSYEWSNGNITSSVADLAPGQYSVTVSDFNLCSTILNVSISSPPALVVSIGNIMDVSCFGYSDGSASVSVSGGTPPYLYLWSTDGTMAAQTNLSAGSYVVTVTDANGCVGIQSITINEPSQLVVNASATDETSPGANDGTATALPGGGSPPYTFLWNTEQTTSEISDLPPGDYTVTVTDNNNCSAEETVTVDSEDCVLGIQLQTTNINCFGDNTGTATAIVSGGQAPFSYIWSNGETGQTQNNLNAGSGGVTVTDNIGCSISANFSITQPEEAFSVMISSQTDVDCNGNASGLVSVLASGGTPPYNYSWSNFSASPDVGGLNAGVYSVTVTDANNCTVTSDVIITEPSLLQANVSWTNESAADAGDGTASASPIGGIAPYTYGWTNGSTEATINNLTPNEYSVTVTDANGCTAFQTISVVPFNCIFNVENTVGNVSCFGANDGQIILNPVGGTPPFSYTWSNGANSSSVTNLASGTYDVTVTDGDNCSAILQFFIKEPAQLISTISEISHAQCLDSNDGYAIVSVQGGVGEYTYEWSTGVASNTVSSLSVGMYSVVVTDSSGCESNSEVEIIVEDNIPPTVIPQDITINLDENGLASITPDMLDLNSSDNCEIAEMTVDISEFDCSNAGENAVLLSVEDVNGNSNSASAVVMVVDDMAPVAVAKNLNITLSKEGVAVINGTMVNDDSYDNCGIKSIELSQDTFHCEDVGENTIEFIVTDNSGNVSVVTALITVIDDIMPSIDCSAIDVTFACDGELIYEMPTIADNCVSAGTFTMEELETEVTFTFTDPGGNTTSCTLTDIVHPEPLAFGEIISTNVLCAGDANGSISVNITGGVAPYSYIWSNGFTESNITDLSAGTYEVEITDANGCTETAMVEITEPDVIGISVNAITNDTDNSNTGAIEIDISGGTEAYIFDWTLDGMTVSTDEDPTGLSAGDYVVIITDANNCTYTSDPVTVDNVVDVRNQHILPEFILIPNPTKGMAMLSVTHLTEDAYLTISNITGKDIFPPQLISAQALSKEIDLSNFASGIYFVQLRTSENIITKRLILNK